MKKLIILPALAIMMMLTNMESKAQKVYDFVSVDKVPDYPGGMKSFYEYLGKSIKFPEAAKKNKIQGKVFLSFIVEQTGKLTDVEVVKGLTKETNDEAVRVLKESPKWNAGTIKGKPVRVKYNIAVNFTQV
ncbi:energy transducer TonB [Pedobacter aquatilis]|uniref:energy transducer TonB n=1 Tax=Pedobacter aquatilis TaxID=351343 RepID=UPI00292D5A35|nr:energy transducer TonB [Pedobacter aquatilis]